ncbi:MAG TPA: hypothetical protein VHA12_01795 [Candidatus Nanoarchaeia archaeon]|nr:hypothetical protein [Candidatus Nanoarchaeia archaeon]
MFKKRGSGVDVVDFTRTKTGKKIAPPKEIAPSVGGFLDFTQQQAQTASVSNTAETPNTFGFLSDFSQSAQTQAQSTENTSFFSNNSDTPEVSALKIKIEDLEFKMERLLERLAEMETKFTRM